MVARERRAAGDVETDVLREERVTSLAVAAAHDIEIAADHVQRCFVLGRCLGHRVILPIADGVGITASMGL